MASFESSFKDNIRGRYFVDDQCIACDACTIEAPKFFKMNDIEGHAFVFKQPLETQDEELCLKALEICPVEAIGIMEIIED